MITDIKKFFRGLVVLISLSQFSSVQAATINGTVDIPTGIVQKFETDYSSADTILPLQLTRKYSSNYPKGDIGAGYLLGGSWRDSLSFRIKPVTFEGKRKERLLEQLQIPELDAVYVFLRGLDGPKYFYKLDNKYHWIESGLPLNLTVLENGWQLVNNQNHIETYSQKGYLVSVVDPVSNIQLTYTYKGKRLVNLERTGGDAIKIRYPQEGIIKAIFPTKTSAFYLVDKPEASEKGKRNGKALDLLLGANIYDKKGKLVKEDIYNYAAPNATKDKKDNKHLLITIANSVGVHTRFTYNDNKECNYTTFYQQDADTGELVEMNAMSMERSEGRITTQNGRGLTTHYILDENDRIIQVEGEAINSCLATDHQKRYDEHGLLISEMVTVDNTASGYAVNEYEYNDRGLLVKTTQGISEHSNGVIETQQWHPTLSKLLRKETDQLTIDYTYDDENAYLLKVLVETDKISGQVRRTTFKYEYFDNGQLQKKTTQVKGGGIYSRSVTAYDQAGRLVRQTHNGEATIYKHYNESGQAQLIIYPTYKEKRQFSDQGQLVSKTQIRGENKKQWRYKYNSQGQRVKTTTPDGVTTQYTYSVLGQLTSMVSSDGITTQYRYNELNQQVEVSKYQDGQLVYQSKSTTDEKGRLATTEDELGTKQALTYTNQDRKKTVVDGEGNSTEYRYQQNEQGETKTEDNPGLDENHTTTDAKGQTTKVAVSEHSFAFEYDSFGNVIKKREGILPAKLIAYANKPALGGKETTLTIQDKTITKQSNKFGLVAMQGQSPQHQTIEYRNAYYQNGQLKGKLKQASVIDGNDNRAIQTNYQYDTNLGLVTETTQAIGDSTLNIKRSYTPSGKLHTLTYPSGFMVTYHYNAQSGQVNSVTSSKGAIVSDVSYLANSVIEQFTLGNGIQTIRDYNLSLELQSSDSDTLSLSYQHDRNGNITQIQDNLIADNTVDYTYDALNRLSSSEGQGETHDYVFDLDNNRIKHTVNDATTDYAYEQGQVLASISTGDKTLTTERDTYGNLTQGEHNGALVTREFNIFNQLIKSTRNGQVTTYGYNSQRQRIWKQTGDDFIQYIYKGNSEKLLAEYTNGTLTKEYVYAFGKLVAINSLNESMYYVQTDHLGRPQVATNERKQIVWQAQNKAFDRAVVINQIGDLNIGFPGQYYDAESGLYCNVNRDYDPTTGRYIQTDPVGLDGGLNTYAYVIGNPVMAIDPDGLNAKTLGRGVCTIAVVGELLIGWYGVSQAPGSLANSPIYDEIIALEDKINELREKIDDKSCPLGKRMEYTAEAANLAGQIDALKAGLGVAGIKANFDPTIGAAATALVVTAAACKDLFR